MSCAPPVFDSVTASPVPESCTVGPLLEIEAWALSMAIALAEPLTGVLRAGVFESVTASPVPENSTVCPPPESEVEANEGHHAVRDGGATRVGDLHQRMHALGGDGDAGAPGARRIGRVWCRAEWRRRQRNLNGNGQTRIGYGNGTAKRNAGLVALQDRRCDCQAQSQNL